MPINNFWLKYSFNCGFKKASPAGWGDDSLPVNVFLFICLYLCGIQCTCSGISLYLIFSCVCAGEPNWINFIATVASRVYEPLLSTSMHMFLKIPSVFFYLSLCIHHINFTFTLSCFCTHLHLGCFWQNCVNKPRSPPPAQTMNTQQQWQWERWRRNVAERNTSSRPVARSNTRHTTHCQSTWWLLKSAPLPLRLVLLAAAVHHLCPALLLLLRNFVPGSELLGVKEATDYYEKYNPGS